MKWRKIDKKKKMDPLKKTKKKQNKWSETSYKKRMKKEMTEKD